MIFCGMMGTTVVYRHSGLWSQQDQMYISHVVCDKHAHREGQIIDVLLRKYIEQ